MGFRQKLLLIQLTKGDLEVQHLRLKKIRVYCFVWPDSDLLSIIETLITPSQNPKALLQP